MAGHFIVIEGVDGAGTTTHARVLCDRLRAQRVPVHLSAEPSGGPIGALLRQALRRRVVAAGPGVGQPLGWSTMGLLFAADRMDHLAAELLPNLGEGVTVVCDRYYHSSVAYQSLAGGGIEAISWLREINARARRPDLTIVLDAPPEVAAQRRRDRGGSAEIYDADAFQRQLAGFYSSLERHFPGESIVHVSSAGSIEEVASRVLSAAETVVRKPESED
jgi:dTMP kinase